MFEHMLLPVGHTHQGRFAAFAFTGEAGLIAIAALLMTYSTVVPRPSETAIPLYLSAPPPPPAPAIRPRARPPAIRTAPRNFIAPVLVAPQTVLQHALIVTDAAIPDTPAGLVGGIPGGMPGGALNGLLGALPTPAPAAPKAQPRPAPVITEPTRISVGGEVEAARIVRQIMPDYPPLAKSSRVQGTVRLSAVIGPDGTVTNLSVVSGNPLLVEAAREAVRQWRYQPTLLNGRPVEVFTVIDVKFTLG